MAPVDDGSCWSLPPNFHNADTGYETSERIGPPVRDQIPDDNSHRFFSRSSSHSKLPAELNDQDDTNSVQKNPLIFENAIPQDDDQQRPSRMWNPIWLHSLVLSALVILFLALLVGLIILWYFARLENGIPTDITENHYAWTYGPTALLVVVGVAWRQVDFYCRTLAPWSHLRGGPAPANASLLLDYVSPILPKILAAAAANNDWAVLASGFGILLLRIVIVFSTGLLVLTPTALSAIIDDAVVTSKFVGTNYTTQSEAIGTTELVQYYGIQKQGLDYEYGTTGTVAYETIDLASVPLNSTVTTTVNGVFPFFNCEIVDPEIVGNNFTWSTEEEGQLDLTLTLTPTKCHPLRSYFTFCSFKGCPVGQYISSNEAWMWPNSYDPLKPPLDDQDPCANLYQLAVTDLQFERIAGHPVNTSAAWNVSISRAMGIVCSLGYTVDTLNIAINTANPTSAGGVNTTGPLRRVADVLPGFSYYNLTMNMETIADFENSLPAPPGIENLSGLAQLTAIMNNGSADALLNTTTMKDSVEKAFKGIAVQMAHSVLRKADNRTAPAQALYQEERLQIRMVSLWAMGVGFVLLAVCGMIVLIWRPRDAVSRNPNSVATHAALFAASPGLQAALAGTGCCTDSSLQMHLGRKMARFYTINSKKHQEIFVETVRHDETSKDPTDYSENQILWWRPMSTTLWFMVLAVVLPLSVIIALEVLQRESEAHNGLVNISPSSIVAHSLPSILASFVLIVIAIMYDAINFAATTLAPYQALARGSATADRTLLGASFGDLPIWSTVQAIRNRYGSAALSSGAAIIGGLLTIISSGLYTIETVQFVSDLQILTADQFVPSFSTLTDGGAGAVFSLIEHNNVSYPALTFDELVFPRMERSSLGEDVTNQLSESEQVTLQASVSAMRASLNCTLVPRDTMVITNSLPPGPAPDTSCPMTTVSFNASLPDSCPHFLDGSNQTATTIQFSYGLQHICGGGTSPNIFVQAVLNQAAAVNGIFLGSQGSTLGASSNPPGCPSLAFLSGYFVVNATSTENFTAMTCIQGLEQVQANTSFVVSKDSIQVRSEPVVDESSTRWLQAFNSTYWFTNIRTFDDFNATGEGSDADAFYQQVHYGPGGLPTEELTGPSNVDRFINATQRTYRRYMAQLINSNMRQNLNSTEAASAPRFPATASDINVLRLQQNATSKLILQVFLGIMLACGVFVYSPRNMRHVLPHCPWSIAGTMSLLAGSEMVERRMVPAGAEFMSDKDLAKVFEGYVFSLGWWFTGAKTSDLKEQRRFGVDVGKADASGRAGVV